MKVTIWNLSSFKCFNNTPGAIYDKIGCGNLFQPLICVEYTFNDLP